MNNVPILKKPIQTPSSHNIDQLFYTIVIYTLIWLPHIHDIMDMRNLPAMNSDRGLITCLNTCTPTYVATPMTGLVYIL